MHQVLSLVQNCKPGPSHGAVLALLLLGSAPEAALAQTQQCPAPGTNLPPVTISSQLPSDVSIPADFPSDCNPIAFFDDFSWKSFIAMVWPVLEGQRGVPVPVALLIEGIDAERDAVREKRSAPGVVERREPVPELGVVLWQLGLPGVVPLGDRLGRGTVLQIRRLDREEYMPHGGLQASA